jgi:hypothetical protein
MGILGMFSFTPKDFSPFMEIIFIQAYSSHVLACSQIHFM